MVAPFSFLLTITDPSPFFLALNQPPLRLERTAANMRLAGLQQCYLQFRLGVICRQCRFQDHQLKQTYASYSNVSPI